MKHGVIAVMIITGLVSLTAAASAQNSDSQPPTRALAGSIRIADVKPQRDTKVKTDPLREQVTRAIEYSRRRFLDGKVHTPWQILHGILALRKDYEIAVDGQKVNALKWIQEGQYHQGQPWVEKTRFGGRFHSYTQPWHFQGHPNQFLAILTLSDLPTTYQFQGAGGKVTIEDMIDDAKATVNDREEITWTLWALSKYLDPGEEWRNRDGEHWSMERLVRIQTDADPNDAACGGTHGLFALTRARAAYEKTGKPLRGVWVDADQKIKRHVSIAKNLQYPDGTFSCNYFVNRSYKNEFSDRLAPTGHTLEFLMVALKDDQLEEDWVRRGVAAVSKDLIENRSVAVDCGPLYHALSGLVIYLDRTAPPPAPKPIVVAENSKPIPAEPKDDASDAPAADQEPLVAPRPAVAEPTSSVSQSAE